MTRPVALYGFCAAGLLFAGCAYPHVNSGVVDRQPAPEPARADLKQAAPVAMPAAVVSPPVWRFTVQWEVIPTPGVVTGLQWSSNCVDWLTLCVWPADTTTNQFTDTEWTPARYYRAFTDWETPQNSAQASAVTGFR